jgi:hypothetical protein
MAVSPRGGQAERVLGPAGRARGAGLAARGLRRAPGGALPAGAPGRPGGTSDGHFREAAAECDRKPGAKWLSCAAR